MFVWFFKVVRYSWFIIKILFLFKCWLKLDFEIFVLGCIFFLVFGLLGFRNSWVGVLEIVCFCWEYFLIKNVCLGFVFLIFLVIMILKKISYNS